MTEVIRSRKEDLVYRIMIELIRRLKKTFGIQGNDRADTETKKKYLVYRVMTELIRSRKQDLVYRIMTELLRRLKKHLVYRVMTELIRSRIEDWYTG